MIRLTSNLVLRILAAILVLVAVAPLELPYAYFQVMNWVVAIASVSAAFQAHKMRQDIWVWVCLSIAVLFNPIAPLHLRADLWLIADMVVGLLLLVSLFFVREGARK